MEWGEELIFKSVPSPGLHSLKVVLVFVVHTLYAMKSGHFRAQAITHLVLFCFNPSLTCIVVFLGSFNVCSLCRIQDLIDITRILYLSRQPRRGGGYQAWDIYKLLLV